MLKKLFALMLVLVTLAPCAEQALAEAPDDALFTEDRNAARWGIAMTAGLMGNACDRLEDPSATLRVYAQSLLSAALLTPDKVFVIDMTEDQFEAARSALNAESADVLASALAEYVNRQFDDNYADVVNAVAHRYDYSGAENKLVVLPYGEHVAVISFHGWAAQSAFIISTKDISQALSAEDIEAYTNDLGLDGLAIRAYEGADRDALLYGETWKSGAAYIDSEAYMASAISRTEGRFRRLFPLMLREDTIDDGLRFFTIHNFLKNAMHDDPMRAARLAAGWALPLMRESDPEATAHFISENNKMVDTFREGRRPPEVAYGETLQEAAPDMSGTFLYVITLNNPERGTDSFFDPILEATLPAGCIPDTPEEADYIIHCNATYADTPDAANSSSAVYCPTTEITLHDAKTGVMIQNLGAVTRPMPRGVVIVSKGNTYYYPYLDQIWETTRALFEGK